MSELLRSVSNDNAGGRQNSAPGHESATRLKSAPDSLSPSSAGLPEDLIAWLHDGLDYADCAGRPEREVMLSKFEASVAAQLFPKDDARSFMVRLHDHCRATANAARVVAEYAGLPYRDTPFVVGFLHDYGIAAGLRDLDARTYFAENDAFRLVWPKVLASESDGSNELARHWRLPSAVRFALREHKSLGTLRSVHEIAASTFVAEHLVGCVGFAFLDEQPTTGLLSALAALRLSKRDLSTMGRRVERSLDRELWPWPRIRFLQAT